MPQLKCSAVTCVFNKQELCSRGDIQVTGDQASTADQTCCGSFQERKGESMTNSCANDPWMFERPPFRLDTGKGVFNV